MKAPAVPQGTPVVNALNAQRHVSLILTSSLCLVTHSTSGDCESL